MVQPRQSHRPPLRAVMEAYVNAAKAGDRVMGVNRAGAVTITLPTAEVRKGRVYTVQDESGAAATNNITVATEGSETIDGSATDVIAENYGANTYYSDGSNWSELPILAAPSIAHSATTGQRIDDHHPQAHTLVSHSTEAHSDLSTPDDNTDLDFSTTAHGLVPKGTNVGDFLKDYGTSATPAGGGGAVTREGGNPTEATTTSTSAVDLLSMSSLTIADTEPFIAVAELQRTTGASTTGRAGLKVNTTATKDPAKFQQASNSAEEALCDVRVGARVTNYTSAGSLNFKVTSGLHTYAEGGDNAARNIAIPTATITDPIVYALINDALATLGADEGHAYSLAASQPNE